MPDVTMRQLLEAGIHFGHQTRRWNPKMRKYIYGERNGIYIIDLAKTLKQVRKACKLIHDVVADGGTVLFVGSKKQAQEPISAQAKRCGMYWITNRWLGGTLTNWQTIQRSIQKLHRLDKLDATGKLDQLSKKEAAKIRKEQQRLERNLCGIKSLKNPPDLLFVIDTKREAIAVREADRLHIPCIGVVDTNADPDEVTLPVPGNDDAIRAVNLYCKVVADAVLEGRGLADKRQAEIMEEEAAGQSIAPEPAAEAEPAQSAAAKAPENEAVGAGQRPSESGGA